MSFRYKQRALELSELYRDRPEDPLMRAAYWVEYVIRHGGTKHFVQSLPLLEELVIIPTIIVVIVLIIY